VTGLDKECDSWDAFGGLSCVRSDVEDEL
jgi:hypothetical protein